MATVTHAATASWSTTGGNVTGTAFTPALSDLLVVIAPYTGTVTTPTVTDNNADGLGTYTQVDSDRTGFSTAGHLKVWVRNALIGSATSTTVSAGQTSSTGGGLDVFRVSGMSLTGAAAVRQSAGQSSGTASTTPAPVMGSAVLTGNPVIGAVCCGTNSATNFTPRTGYTEASDLGYNTPAAGMETMFRSSGETGSTLTWGSAAPATTFASVVVELDTSVPEDSSALELSGFGADTLVHSYDTINSVKVSYTHHETAGTLAPTLQLWDGTSSQIGSTFTCTTSTTDVTDTAVFTGISYSQLATLRVRVFAHGTTGHVESADAVGIVVNYTAGTPPPATQAIVNAAPKLPPRRISYVSPQVIFGPVAVTSSSPALTDSGAGTDALAAAAAVPLADSGSGSDVLAAPAGVSLAESGSGADALALTAAVPLAESGTGTDLLAVAQPVALTDSGTGTDALAITAAVPLAEAGSGSDALTAGPGTPAALTDTGAGSDALSVTVQAPLSGAGAGTDLLTAAAQAGLADSGAGTDALAAPAATVLADSGAGTDALAVAAAAQLTDSGAGSDAVTAGGGTPVSLTDSGTGTDVLSVTAHAVLPEAGAGSDALATVSGIVKTDTDSCTASESGFAFIASSEAGTAADGAEAIRVRDTDRCAMAERELTRWPRDSDLCAAAERGWQSGPVHGGTDTCHASDGQELVTLASSDACQAADTAPDIEVYTYVPPFRTGPGGGWYKVAWGDTEVLRVPRADGAVLRFAAALARAREVRAVTDADCCTAAEASRPVTGVTIAVGPALEVAIVVSSDIPAFR